MKTIQEYADALSSNMLIESVESAIRGQAASFVDAASAGTAEKAAEATVEQKKYWIDLPYAFDIYNEGAKNVDFKISFANIWRLIRNACHEWYDAKYSDGTGAWRAEKDYSAVEFAIELPAEEFVYWGGLDLKKYSNNFTKIPNVKDKAYFTNYSNRDYKYELGRFAKLMRKMKPYFKSGKLSCVMKLYNSNDNPQTNSPFSSQNNNTIIITVNDKKFQDERAARLDSMTNPDNLAKWSAEQDKKDIQKEISAEKYRIEQAERERKNSKFEMNKRTLEWRKMQTQKEKELREKGWNDKQIKDYWYDQAVQNFYANTNYWGD